MLKNHNDSAIILPHGYKPSEDEPFMNSVQKEYFRQKLFQWRQQLVEESTETIHQMKDKVQEPDFIDAACQEIHETIELRARDRDRKLVNKIRFNRIKFILRNLHSRMNGKIQFNLAALAIIPCP